MAVQYKPISTSGPTRPAAAKTDRALRYAGGGTQVNLRGITGEPEDTAGERANQAGAAGMAISANRVVESIISQGIAGGMSVGSVARLTSKALEAFTRFNQYTGEGTGVNRNSFSAQQPGGLKANWRTLLRQNAGGQSMLDVARQRGWTGDMVDRLAAAERAAAAPAPAAPAAAAAAAAEDDMLGDIPWAAEIRAERKSSDTARRLGGGDDMLGDIPWASEILAERESFDTARQLGAGAPLLNAAAGTAMARAYASSYRFQNPWEID